MSRTRFKRFRRDQKAQLQVLEGILVGVMVFVAIAYTAIFRLPSNPSTFAQAELSGLGSDVLLALAAKPPALNPDCNEVPCPFKSELERMLSLALAYQGATVVPGGETRDVDPLADYLDQSLPEGTRYLFYYSNGVADTLVHPQGIVPPALHVVVSHAFLSPAWTSHAASLDGSVQVRIGEYTGFLLATTDYVADPLNRDRDEWGVLHKDTLTSLLGDIRVPEDVQYGTHQLCPPAAPCVPFTIVPQGVFPPGSMVLPGDRDNSTGLRNFGAFMTSLKWYDQDSNGLLASTEEVYLDIANLGTVGTGDLRFTSIPNCTGAATATCYAGSFVDAALAHVDVGRALASPIPAATVRHLAGDVDGVLDETEHIYLDVNNDGSVGAGDRRLSRVGTYPMGSVVVATDVDNTAALAGLFASETAQYADLDADLAPDVGEPFYLDFAGEGQSSGVEAYDLHLSQIGSPTVRYIYDVRLVVWFGI